MLWIALETLAFSSVWVALAAGMLCAASAKAMAIAPSAAVAGVVFAGTLAVYNVDRVRDLGRDRRTAPRRSDFVERFSPWLLGASWLAAGVAGVLALRIGVVPALALLPVLVLGLFHRRMKRFAFVKAGYISLAWLMVVVAFPAVAAGEARHLSWTAAIVGLAILANAIASNVRDDEAGAGQLGAKRALWLARLAAAVGVGVAFAAPTEIRALCWIPAATLAVLAPFDAGERYTLVVVDGALLLGASAALML